MRIHLQFLFISILGLLFSCTKPDTQNTTGKNCIIQDLGISPENTKLYLEDVREYVVDTDIDIDTDTETDTETETETDTDTSTFSIMKTIQENPWCWNKNNNLLVIKIKRETRFDSFTFFIFNITSTCPILIRHYTTVTSYDKDIPFIHKIHHPLEYAVQEFSEQRIVGKNTQTGLEFWVNFTQENQFKTKILN